MEIILEKDLPHQQTAIDRIRQVFQGVKIHEPEEYYQNPLVDLSDPLIMENIKSVQHDVAPEYRSPTLPQDHLNLDIKMETGTGKTYVYTKTMYELHHRYGFNKFIIVVPSLSIKAGTGQFLRDPYVLNHFKDVCGYGTEVKAGILESVSKKKGRFHLPTAVREFTQGSRLISNFIYVLVLNMQLLTSAKVLTRDDYDQEVLGLHRPIDMLKAVRPIVIIDEPHRFSRGQKAYQAISDQIKPQCIIRFGATFPEITQGRGRNRVTTRDYQNLLYDLNACEAFNRGLIKGVAKEHFEPASKIEEKVKITSMIRNQSVSFQYRKKDDPPRTFTLHPGDSMALVHSAFAGIRVESISASSVTFSNGIEKHKGEEIDVDIYMTSYQEQMLRLALKRHFEIERQNFTGRPNKIKTLALFFIDDITSYRPDPDGKAPYLLEAFERLLEEAIKETIDKLGSHEQEYRQFLEASLADIPGCHAGYFAQDNIDTDENIAKQVEAILHGKKQLLSFKDEEGNYNVLRFLFSKWTLKEGWDNPNIFTITKLRSSGSETSKLQEVGRGLRLPVDEHGNRVANEEFHLNYIVDFTEADFAQRLVDQINSEIPMSLTISDEKHEEVAKKLGKDPDMLFAELLLEGYIDRDRNINPEKRDKFFEDYPDYEVGLVKGKIRNNNEQKPKQIGIRKDVYNELKDLWEAINQRYLLFYDPELDEKLEDVVLQIFKNPDTFAEMTIRSEREKVVDKEGMMTTVAEAGVQYTITRPMPYNDFLKRISNATNIPITIIHKAMCRFVEERGEIVGQALISERAVGEVIRQFREWCSNNLEGRFYYKKSPVKVGETALTFSDGTPRETIPYGRIGIKDDEGKPNIKYLYDKIVYDSELEKKNILSDIDEVVVYGKIPRKSIAIPTIAGGTYSPDFMYVVRRKNGEKELHLIVETKDVENKTELRAEEEIKINCAEEFFKQLQKEGYDVKFHTQLGNKEIRQIINEVLIV